MKRDWNVGTKRLFVACMTMRSNFCGTVYQPYHPEDFLTKITSKQIQFYIFHAYLASIKINTFCKYNNLLVA